MEGPGYTCSCPEGYAGNAFQTAAAFQAHQKGKNRFLAMFNASGASDFDEWLKTERSMTAGFAVPSLADVADELICRDVRSPSLGCAQEPCQVIELEAASVQALVLKNDRNEMLQNPVLAAESCKSKWDFVYEIIKEQKAVEKYCGESFSRCLVATDFVWDSPDEPRLATDYQSDIKLLGISPSMTADAENCLPACASADPHEYPGGGDCASWFCNPLEYQAQFEVTDKAQNSAEINLTIVVRPIDMTKIISDPTSAAAKTFTELATNVETTFADGFVFRFIPGVDDNWGSSLLVTIHGSFSFHTFMASVLG
eukprot:FR738210.1.p1 GENE.FR738210.1~~FR738210.1.p1  ORF type:complete len:351 (+),score=59.76 FR738210.1:120-1055(+)